MNILSFTYWRGSHDTAAALVRDGRIIAAVEEERLSRKQHDDGLPVQSIDYCLGAAGLEMRDIDCIAFPGKPFRSGRDSYLGEIDGESLRKLAASGLSSRRSLLHKRLLDLSLRFGVSANWGLDPYIAKGFRQLTDRYGRLPPVRYYEHHRAHAAASFLTSGWDHAAVATIDGRGGPYATATWLGEDATLARLDAEPFVNSLGFFYRDSTLYLGLGEFGEGKTMGLAAYGHPNRFRNNLERMISRNGAWCTYAARPSLETVGFLPRTREPIMDGPYCDFAAAVQRRLEEVVEGIARSAVKAATSRNLCLAGGVTLNCAANGRLLSAGVADSIWVFPAAGDSGLPVGAALLCASEAGEWQRARIEHCYFGPEYTDSDYRRAIDSEPRVAAKVARSVCELVDTVASLIAEGKVIGWFQGRMELGPRALCNRSILADPRSEAIRDRVNRIKGREEWRPLAPVVIEEKAGRYFEINQSSPFMLFASLVRTEARDAIPGVVHVDGTARPQTLARCANPLVYDLLSAFERAAGVPILLNTSFNAADEPIVCSPTDALRTFLRTGLDVLVMGTNIVTRRSRA
jgi:carbamoyltransferase